MTVKKVSVTFGENRCYVIYGILFINMFEVIKFNKMLQIFFFD